MPTDTAGATKLFMASYFTYPLLVDMSVHAPYPLRGPWAWGTLVCRPWFCVADN